MSKVIKSKKMSLLNRLTMAAEFLDSKSMYKKADLIDQAIIKLSSGWEDDYEPTDEELEEMERWLDEFDIEPDDLTEETVLSGLEGKDKELAEKYLNKKVDEAIADLLDFDEDDVRREEEQQAILKELSELLLVSRILSSENPELANLPFRPVSIPEASFGIFNKLIKAAGDLDQKRFFKESGLVEELAIKFAGIDDIDEDLYDEGEDLEEPSYDQLLEAEYMYNLLEFVEDLANNKYTNLEMAKNDARRLLSNQHGHGIDEGHKAPQKGENTKGKVLTFPKR